MHKEFRLPDLLPADPVGKPVIVPILPILGVISDQRRLEKHPPVDLAKVLQSIESLGVADHRVAVIENERPRCCVDVLGRRDQMDNLTLGFSIRDAPL